MFGSMDRRKEILMKERSEGENLKILYVW